MHKSILYTMATAVIFAVLYNISGIVGSNTYMLLAAIGATAGIILLKVSYPQAGLLGFATAGIYFALSSYVFTMQPLLAVSVYLSSIIAAFIAAKLLKVQ